LFDKLLLFFYMGDVTTPEGVEINHSPAKKTVKSVPTIMRRRFFLGLMGKLGAALGLVAAGVNTAACSPSLPTPETQTAPKPVSSPVPTEVPVHQTERQILENNLQERMKKFGDFKIESLVENFENYWTVDTSERIGLKLRSLPAVKEETNIGGLNEGAIVGGQFVLESINNGEKSKWLIMHRKNLENPRVAYPSDEDRQYTFSTLPPGTENTIKSPINGNEYIFACMNLNGEVFMRPFVDDRPGNIKDAAK